MNVHFWVVQFSVFSSGFLNLFKSIFKVCLNLQIPLHSIVFLSICLMKTLTGLSVLPDLIAFRSTMVFAFWHLQVIRLRFHLQGEVIGGFVFIHHENVMSGSVPIIHWH